MIFLSSFILDIIRLNNQVIQSFFVKFFSLILKENEKYKFTAVTPYFFSCFLTILLFPKEIAVLSLLFLIIGDPFASFIGIKYGRIKLKNNKSLEGLLGFIFITFTVGCIAIFSNFGNYENHIFKQIDFITVIFVLLITSIISALSEFFCGNYLKGLIDDNLVIPLASAFSLSILLISFETLSLDDLKENFQNTLIMFKL